MLTQDKHAHRASIRTRLNLLVIGAVALSTLPVAGLFVADEARLQAQVRWTTVTTAANLLAGDAVDAAETHNPNQALAALRTMTRIPGVAYARIDTTDRGLLAETGAGARLPGGLTLPADAPHVDIGALAFNPTLRVTAPIRRGAQELGRVTLVQSANGFTRRLLQSLAGIFVLSGSTLALALWLARRMQRAMTRPLADLTASIAAITSRGDLSTRIETPSRDEVGTLAGGFNLMLDAIGERDAGIEARLHALEAEVAARTRDCVRAGDEAKAANAARSGLLATLSHDIRTPMAGLVILAERLATGALPAGARGAAQTLARTARGVLAVIDGGEPGTEIDEIDVLDLVDDTLALFTSKAREKGLELITFADPAAPRLVPADALRLSQILSQIVANALNFTDNGHVGVQIATDPKPGFWRLIVRDTGIGIDKDGLGAIFTATEPEDPATRLGGLATAKRLAEAMGGGIAVAGEPGAGTQVHIRLPVTADAPRAAPPTAHGRTVAIHLAATVEREALAARFEAAGVTVVEAPDARDDAEAADLILADSTARDAVAAPAGRLVLLVEPEDDGDAWVTTGRAAAALARPLRYRDIDALIDGLKREEGMHESPAAHAPSLPAATDDTLFDAAVIHPLFERRTRRDDDDAVVIRVLDLYRRRGPEALADMVAAHRARDTAALARAAQTLKAMSLNIGARAVAGAASGIEKAIRVEGRAVTIDEVALTHSYLDQTLSALAELSQPGAAGRALATVPDFDEALARELEASLAAGAFEMVYQPIYDRTGTQIVSAEALIRWPRHGRAPIGPDVFVPLAERKGLIGRIGAFARHRALSDAADWDIPVALNVSPLELETPGFVTDIAGALRDTGFAPERLVLEMTETALMRDPLRIEAVFEDLHDMGVKLALDDFGAGYSSLTALQRFHFDKVKIDKVFVTALEGELRPALEALAIIQAISGLGRVFGMQVVAEGIETAKQHQHLKAAGIHGLQGYLFGKPMTASELTAVLEAGEAKAS